MAKNCYTEAENIQSLFLLSQTVGYEEGLQDVGEIILFFMLARGMTVFYAVLYCSTLIRSQFQRNFLVASYRTSTPRVIVPESASLAVATVRPTLTLALMRGDGRQEHDYFN